MSVSVFYLAKICSRCSILLSHMCFGIRILSLIHLTTLTIPIQNPKCLKNAKTHPRTTIFPLPFEVQPRICRLYKCIHRQPKLRRCALWFAGHRMWSIPKGAILMTEYFLSILNEKKAAVSVCKLPCSEQNTQIWNMCCPRVRFLPFWFWMGIAKVVRWIGLQILIPKHIRKSQIQHLEQILAQKR